ncbi:MAG: hypothetical protein ACK4NC_00755 [Candidatus Gracilibacteria bacterium]
MSTKENVLQKISKTKAKKINTLWKKILKSVPGPTDSELAELLEISVISEKVAEYILRLRKDIFLITKVKEYIPNLTEQVNERIEYSLSGSHNSISELLAYKKKYPSSKKRMKEAIEYKISEFKISIDVLFDCQENYPSLGKKIEKELASKSASEFTDFIYRSTNSFRRSKICNLLLAGFPSLETIFYIERNVQDYVLPSTLKEMPRTKDEFLVFLKNNYFRTKDYQNTREEVGAKLLSGYTLTLQEYATVMLIAQGCASVSAEYILKDKLELHPLYYALIALYTPIQTQFFLNLDPATKKQLEDLKLRYESYENGKEYYSAMDIRFQWIEWIEAIGTEYEERIKNKFFDEKILGILPLNDIEKFITEYSDSDKYRLRDQMVKYVKKGFPGSEFAAKRILADDYVPTEILKIIIQNVPLLKEDAGIRMKKTLERDFSISEHEFLIRHFPEWKLTPLTSDLMAEIKTLI